METLLLLPISQDGKNTGRPSYEAARLPTRDAGLILVYILYCTNLLSLAKASHFVDVESELQHSMSKHKKP